MTKILEKIRGWFEVPFDPSDEKTNRDAILSGLLSFSTIIAVAYAFPIILRRGLFSTQALVLLGTSAVFVALRIALERKKRQFSSLILLLVIWGAVMYEFLWLENGLRAPAYSAALAFLVAYAGLLLGKNVAWGVLIISVVINIGVAVGEEFGYYLTKPEIPGNQWVIIGQVIFLSGITYMLTLTLRNLKKSINLYREEAESRKAAEMDIRRLHGELESAYETTLEGWALALELRDKETEGHSRRVTDLTLTLAACYQLSEEEIRFIRYGALLHDVGKMGIPDEILNKPGPLTAEERQVVNQHPDLAFDMLKGIQYLEPALPIPCSHHENWDGTGYPIGFEGEDIPLAARLFAVVDNWDALLSDRPYRKAWPREKVVAYLNEERGKKFDPQVVDVFLNEVI